MQKSLILAVGLVAAPASAATITVTIPRVNASEYHNPYVAVWVEPVGGGAARTLAVWYDVDLRGNEPGTKWLADLRTWWRKGGRNLNLPADGVSGMTKAPGAHRVTIPSNLRAGSYTLFVEAVREDGGREIVSMPLAIPAANGRAAGRTELGAITLSAR